MQTILGKSEEEHVKEMRRVLLVPILLIVLAIGVGYLIYRLSSRPNAFWLGVLVAALEIAAAWFCIYRGMMVYQPMKMLLRRFREANRETLSGTVLSVSDELVRDKDLWGWEVMLDAGGEEPRPLHLAKAGAIRLAPGENVTLQVKLNLILTKEEA